MNSVSSLLRIVCGLALLILAYSTYQKALAQVSSGAPIQIFGVTTGASPGLLTLGLAAVGLIGAGLLALGVMGLLKNRS